ncbi:MAG: PorP/SprF family type IX secretion system membrane protein [Chitinophagales bacterium]
MNNLYKNPVAKNTNSRLAAGCLCLCLLASPVFVHAQADIHFSQFYETSILRNPALTGVFADDYKFGAYYRNQWSSIANPFQTGLISAETHVPVSARNKDFFSFGLLGYADEAGNIDQKITAIYLALNYNKSLNPDHNTYLSVGFTGGYLQYSFDGSKATFNNQYQNGHFDPNNPILEALPNSKLTALDAGAGINFNTSSGEDNKVTYVIGVSGYHFNQPKFSYYQIPNLTEEIRWNGNLGMSCNFTDNLNFMIQGNYALEGAYTEAIFGGIFNFTAAKEGFQDLFVISCGVFYRYGDAIIPVVKLKNKKMSLGVSYDINVSSLKEASNMSGGFEMSLFISGSYSNDNDGPKVCPRF